MIDTHAHIQKSEYEDYDKVVLDAINQSVEKIICVGFDIASSIEAVEVANKYESVYAVIGIHPSEVENVDENYIETLKNLAKNKKVVAIGEIGLDYHFEPYNKELQKKIFVEQIKCAHSLNLPICIHSRDATKDLLDTLNENKEYLTNGGVLHCFGESVETFNIIKKYNFKISIGGVLTYKNARNVQNAILNIPLEYIMLETDSPWLTPEPYRGKCKNEPKYVKYVLEKLAEIKNLPIKEVEEITTKNAYELFKFKD